MMRDDFGQILEGFSRPSIPDFIQSHYQIIDKSGQLVRLIFTEVQREIVEAILGSGDVRILKARQVGATTAVLSLMLEICRRWRRTGYAIFDNERRLHNARRNIETFAESAGIALDSSRAAFVELANGSRIHFDTGAGKPIGISQVGHMVLISECGKFEDETTLQNLWENAIASIPPNMEYTFRVQESVPGVHSGAWHVEYLSAKENPSIKTLFLPWWRVPEYVAPTDPWMNDDKFTEREKTLMLEHDLSQEQLAYRRREIKNTYHKSEERFKLQMPESDTDWFLEEGLFLNAEVIAKAKDNATKPLHITTPVPGVRLDGIKLWQLEPKKGKVYVLGMDCSPGDPEGDPAAIEVIEWSKPEQVASWRGWDDYEGQAMRLDWLSRHFNNALIVVERDDSGARVLDHAQGLRGEEKKRWEGNELVVIESPWLNIHYHNPEQLIAGVPPVGGRGEHSRYVRLFELKDFCDSMGEKFIHDEEWWEEAAGFKRHKGTRVAEGATHDDRILAMSWALYGRDFARQQAQFEPTQYVENLLPDFRDELGLG